MTTLDAVMTKQLTVTPSLCDSRMLLDVPACFALCMDLAGEHAEALGNGIGAMMDRGLFWVAVKTALRFSRRPALWETVTAETWPEAPGRMRGNRDYVLRRGGEVLVSGKTEWTILNTRAGGLHSPRDGIYDPALAFCPEQARPAPFHRFTEREGWEDLADYTVRSTDIDMGGHMNNAAYVRMLAGLFPVDRRNAFGVSEAEIHYRASCYEGDALRIQKRRAEDALELRVERDGETAVLARVLPAP